MCGRYTRKYTWDQIQRLAGTKTPDVQLRISYNVAPTQQAPVIRQIEGECRVDLLRWGLIPSWAKDEKIGGSLINARAETVATKPSFRSAFKARRCLVPISGFYEWRKLDDKRKQPHYIHLASQEPMFLAGLWERWNFQDPPIESYAIITTTANAMMARIHDRMPAIIDPSDITKWLNPATTPQEAATLLRPAPDGILVSHPVSTLVNSPRNDAPECIEALPT